MIVHRGGNMSLSSQVKVRLNKFSNSQIFTYSDFSDLGNFEAVANALSRLKKSGVINRIAKGKYFVPKNTRFGIVGPSEAEILKSYLKEQGGYVAGLSTFNSLGLSTQIPNEILISGVKSSRKQKLGQLNIRFQKGPLFKFKQEEIPLIQILEALKEIKKIPNSNINNSIKILRNKIERLDKNKKERIVQLVSSYRPSVNALLGALLEKSEPAMSNRLRKNLNPFSKYKIGVSIEALENKKKWNIE